jgi:hypothetical protein
MMVYPFDSRIFSKQFDQHFRRYGLRFTGPIPALADRTPNARAVSRFA